MFSVVSISPDDMGARLSLGFFYFFIFFSNFEFEDVCGVAFWH